MPVAPVNDQGAVLYYEDTGVPPSAPQDYVTVILLHGAMFHSGNFKHVHAYAVPNKLRLVFLNARDYPGSSLYTAAELAALEGRQGGTDAQAAAIAARALEFVTFISWFIETQGIPPISVTSRADGTTGGGVAFVGWSAGNLQTISLLAHADKAPEKTRALFDAYLRSLVIYDPWRDPSLNIDQQTAAFLPWISGYYTQIDSSPDWATFEAALTERTKLDRAPTCSVMSAEDVAASTDVVALQRSQTTLEFMDPSVYRDVVRRALYDCCGPDSPAPGAKEPIWPKMRVEVLWCGMDVGDVVWTAHLYKRDAEEARKAGKVARTVGLTRVDGANHFVSACHLVCALC
ncbi:hypothetical protein B0H21DRAFT_779875 [Amylocystis lapponica]|nr:hypothetical protein B0H21DRAFT_779875 [Amylocystis lapponica]